jgi:hypothetical protein
VARTGATALPLDPAAGLALVRVPESHRRRPDPASGQRPHGTFETCAAAS